MLDDKDMQGLKAAAAAGEVAWNAECDKIKAKHGGYPRDWFEKVILSGIVASVARR